VLDLGSLTFESEFDVHYGLLSPEQTVLVRAYSDDTDDRMLAEIQPKFIVMFEPNMEFIRRIEVREDCVYISLTLTFEVFYHRCIRVLILDCLYEYTTWCTAIPVKNTSIWLV
jgi:DNA excision repair protein ERCC-4